MSACEVRPERTSDRGRVDEIVTTAFGRDAEARLVRVLREQAHPRLSLVAEADGELVGHVFFSPVAFDPPRTSPAAAGLAPLAVAPAWQGRGAGTALVRAGLRECLEIGWQAVFLLGEPAYYARFGFELAAPTGLRYQSESFDAAFQSIELVPGALSGCRGWIRYHDAFDAV